ncbi:hypothetical protein GB937_010577 [Aspergillus fischeri]|nr:hypothetical protein GB937_010577 [Aspergillus fischeri]
MPYIIELKEDIGEVMKRLYNITGQKFQEDPQLLIIISGHCVKLNPQYASNVLMKVNAKLGGTTAQAVPKVTEATLRPRSHSPLGVWAPSTAAMSVCMDTFSGRYWGSCETNGDRLEIIATSNIECILTPLVREWMATVGESRDLDYSEKVLKEEVFDIKKILMKLSNDYFKGKFTVVIANKCHHLRAFPHPGDRNSADYNGNPLPGTLIT